MERNRTVVGIITGCLLTLVFVYGMLSAHDYNTCERIDTETMTCV